MSRLYYRSRIVVEIEVAKKLSNRSCRMRVASCARIALQFIAAPMLSPFAPHKHAFPNRRLIAPAGSNRSTCRNKVRLLCVISEAQYQAFVRFAVASSAALSAIALNLTCLLEPLPGRAL
jgi:hypothetical protein